MRKIKKEHEDELQRTAPLQAQKFAWQLREAHDAKERLAPPTQKVDEVFVESIADLLYRGSLQQPQRQRKAPDVHHSTRRKGPPERRQEHRRRCKPKEAPTGPGAAGSPAARGRP